MIFCIETCAAFALLHNMMMEFLVNKTVRFIAIYLLFRVVGIRQVDAKDFQNSFVGFDWIPHFTGDEALVNKR